MGFGDTGWKIDVDQLLIILIIIDYYVLNIVVKWN